MSYHYSRESNKYTKLKAKQERLSPALPPPTPTFKTQYYEQGFYEDGYYE